MNKLLLFIGMALFLCGCFESPAKSKDTTKQEEIKANDIDRVNVYNELDNLKEGIWRVDEWKRSAKDICDKSNGSDCAVMADVYYNDFYGYGSKKDIEKSFTILTKGCELLDSQSCLDLAIITDKSKAKNKNVKDIFVKAYDLAKQKCDDNYAVECFVLSQIHFIGYNVFSRDRGVAKDLANKSCNMGYARACIFLGINADTRESAQDAYKKACNLGIKEFCK